MKIHYLSVEKEDKFYFKNYTMVELLKAIVNTKVIPLGELINN